VHAPGVSLDAVHTSPGGHAPKQAGALVSEQAVWQKHCEESSPVHTWPNRQLPLQLGAVPPHGAMHTHGASGI